MFGRILIANRGEIACRVCDRAPAGRRDRRRLFRRRRRRAACGDGRHRGPDRPAARRRELPARRGHRRGGAATGAEAIHPGYGFLSENPDFVEAVAAAGLVFVGPPAQRDPRHGAEGRGQGADGERPGCRWCPATTAGPGRRAAGGGGGAIGYPVLIKAVAGGGGKGMRRVDAAGDFAAALASARGEARAAFGNEAVLIEKYVDRAAPRRGAGVRRRPRAGGPPLRARLLAAAAPPEGDRGGAGARHDRRMRAAMGEAAVQAAKAIGYAGAGTVEFIVDGSGVRPDRFWFMEMNTRLQVEHPVTEVITGGTWSSGSSASPPASRCRSAQEELAIRGHAVEARLYAEDPAQGLPAGHRHAHHLPSRRACGPTPACAPATRSALLRSDDRQADRPRADPRSALARLARALDATRVAGSVTNLDFLARLARQPDFAAGRVDTGLIERDLEALTAPRPASSPAAGRRGAGGAGLLDLADPLAGFALWAPLGASVGAGRRGRAERVRVAVLGRAGSASTGARVEVVDWRDGELALRNRRPAAPLRPRGRPARVVTVFDGAEAHVFGFARSARRGRRAPRRRRRDPRADAGAGQACAAFAGAPVTRGTCWWSWRR